QPVEEVVETERDEVRLVDPRRRDLGAFPDLLRLFPRGQSRPRVAEPANALVAARAAEDEIDRRKHPLLGEHVDDLLAAWNVHAAVALSRTRSPAVLRSSAPPPLVRANAELLLIERDDVRVRQQDAVLLDVHRVQPPSDEVMVLERDRAPLLDDH